MTAVATTHAITASRWRWVPQLSAPGGHRGSYASRVTDTLYLDFDGVLHPANMRATAAEPTRPRVYNGGPIDHPLLEHAGLLQPILAPSRDMHAGASRSIGLICQ